VAAAQKVQIFFTDSRKPLDSQDFPESKTPAA
jgi:hypothetical protein